MTSFLNQHRMMWCQLLFAVYNKGLRKGKGKGKPRSSPDQPGQAVGKGKGRCLNWGKEGHRTDECKSAKVPSWERPGFDGGKPPSKTLS